MHKITVDDNVCHHCLQQLQELPKYQDDKNKLGNTERERETFGSAELTERSDASRLRKLH